MTRTQTQKALGDCWKAFAAARRTFDTGNRLLNGFFQGLLTESRAAADRAAL